MKKILIVFTGGTIGSCSNNGIITTQKNNVKNEYKLLKLYKEQYENPYVTFDTIEPYNILSENLHPKEWEKLIQSINTSLYDGIIITHGTDTLAYSAAFLSLYYNNIAIPMVLVSSDYVLEDPSSNGLINFNTAIEFIQKVDKAGVFVSYMNKNENPKIHFAFSLSQSLPMECYFRSIQNKTFMEYIDGEFITLNDYSCSHNNQTLDFKNYKKTLLIRPYPGIDYENYNLDKIDVVVHDLYHAGTACTSISWGDEYSLVNFIKKCKKYNISVYLAPMNDDDSVYESTKLLEDSGAIIEKNKSIEMVYVEKMFY